MKKTNNKGFSLVELIIVIAIMAILAGAIAPALIKYIDRSRKSNDVSACKSLKTAFETALTNEDIYTALVASSDTTLSITANSTSVTGAAGFTNAMASEVFSNLSGAKAPKLKYTKKGASSYNVIISADGEVKVEIAGSGSGSPWAICPEVCDEYQK